MSIQLNFKCNESWEQMPKNATGSFCDKCEKNVFDLTNKTEYEIHELYKANNGKLCGKINSNQLGIAQQQMQQYSLAKFCCSLFLVFGSLLFNYELQAQNIQTDSTAIVVKSDSTFLTLKGLIVDKKSKKPIAFAVVYFDADSNKIGTTTDFDGKFSFQINRKFIKKDTIAIYASSIGYQSLKIANIDVSNKKPILFKLELRPAEVFMGYIISCPPIIDSDPDAHRSETISGKEIRRSPY